ncbi:MAG: hypothetical protein Q9168_003245 [Polycauliona sp. 1 TL-2023]
MNSNAVSRPWRLASLVLMLLDQSLTLAQGTQAPRQPGIAASCTTFVTVNPGDTCFDTAQAAGITLAQLTMWNPVLGGPHGDKCPTQFLAGNEYCVGVTPAKGIHKPTLGFQQPPTQSGIAANCNAYVEAKPGDTCVDTAKAAGITLAQLTMWNPVLGGPDGDKCPTQFLAGYEYCIRIDGVATMNGDNPKLALEDSFRLNATNTTFTPFQNGGQAIAAINGSFFIGVDPLIFCKDCPSNTSLYSVSKDRCAIFSNVGPHQIFVSNSTGSLSYVQEVKGGDDMAGEKGMEQGFTVTEGGFIKPGSGVFTFAIGSGQPLEWEACEVQGMKGVWQVFVQGIGSAVKVEECVQFVAVASPA